MATFLDSFTQDCTYVGNCDVVFVKVTHVDARNVQYIESFQLSNAALTALAIEEEKTTWDEDEILATLLANHSLTVTMRE